MNASNGPHNIHELLSAFADGELDAAQNLAVIDYLEAHPDALDDLRDLQRLRESAQRVVLADAGANAVPDALKRRLNALAADVAPDRDPLLDSGRHGSPRRWFPRASIGLAAAIAIGFGIAAWLGSEFRRPIAERSTTAPGVASADDARDAAIPASIVRTVTHVHLDCSRLAERLHAEGYPDELGPLEALVKSDLGTSNVAAPDLSSIGYHYVGAGRCAAPLKTTVHLLYRKDGPSPRAAVSVFVQPFAGQFAIERSRVYSIRGEDATFPMYAWRTDKVIYFLIADDAPTATWARRAIPTSPEARGT